MKSSAYWLPSVIVSTIVVLVIAACQLALPGAQLQPPAPVSPANEIQPVVLAEEVNTCQPYPGAMPWPAAGHCFVSGLVHPDTGLVSSREDECFTTVYKAALAALTFIHEGDIADSERIFDFFQAKLSFPFPGFRQAWNACNGQPDQDSDYWEGDNAFLLLALNYYAQSTGSYGRYGSLATALQAWLTSRAASCSSIVAEGTANMYAALEPLDPSWNHWLTLSRLQRCFFASKDYSSVADHIVRGSLVFGDATGFDSLSNFRRTEEWSCDGRTIQAYSAFASDDFINVEISAQLLLAQQLWQIGDPSHVRSELMRLGLQSQQSATCAGFPYFVRHPAAGGFPGDYSLPIVDPTAYLLYDHWRLNPFAPGRLHAGCPADRSVTLVTEGQQQRFPRLFRVGQDPLDPAFPQEINDGDHRQIVIEFTTARDLASTPMTLTVDTVDRGAAFSLEVKLDDGDHCLVACEHSGTLAISGEVGTLPLGGRCERTYLPLATTNAATVANSRPLAVAVSDARTYQLTLQGIEGWAVFDWLQLATPEEILWTIGSNDNRCIEFDNNGFSYPCN